MTIQSDLVKILGSAVAIQRSDATVTLSDGTVAYGLPGVATIEDALLAASGSINGMEKTLKFSAADVPGLKAGDSLTWAGQAWRAKYVHLIANGFVAKVYLQEVV